MNSMLCRSAVFLAFALLTGCSKPNASSIAASHSQLFPSGQLKEQWDITMAAMQTNGYVTAVTTLKKMQLEDVNDTQLNAINDTLRTLNEQMITAAGKGDANASSALEQLSKRGQSRPR